MGITIYQTLGSVGSVKACSHFAERFDAGKLPMSHRLTIIGNLFLCDGCFYSLGFGQFVSLADLSLEEVIKAKNGRMVAFDFAYEAI
jgi:hypothetical protein